MCITARRFIINVGLERIGYEQLKEFKLMDRCLQVRDVVRLLDELDWTVVLIHWQGVSF